MDVRTNPLQSLSALLVLLASLFLLGSCSAEDTRAVTVTGYNYTERPIYTFSVNGAGGSNLFAKEKHGGGAFSCCTEITIGKPAVIKWMYSYTKKQYEAGLREENHTSTVTVPPSEVPDADFLEVHFYPDHHVELALVKFPGEARWSEIPNPGELHE